MTVLIFDTELTDRKEGEIIEAAWLEILCDPIITFEIPKHLDTAYTYTQSFKPTKPITFGAMAVHHILPDELQNCPPSSDFALPDDTDFIIGHSIDFDWTAAGSPAKVKRIDTYAIAQWLWPEATGYSQTALIYMLLGPTHNTRTWLQNQAHSALGDCWMNLHILGEILARKPEIKKWHELWEYSEECRIPRTCPMKRYEGVLLEDLEDGFIGWCLDQSWLDPYFRKGLERVRKSRYAPSLLDDDEYRGDPYE